jgi:hypothetical protein
MEHGSTGHSLNLTDQPLALDFADSHPRLIDEIRVTPENEDALVGGEDVTEEGDVAPVECVGRGGYRTTAEELTVELDQCGRCCRRR